MAHTHQTHHTKIAGLILVLFLFSMNLAAQEYFMESHLEARLESMLILNVDPEVKIEFGITKVNDNLYQITKYPDDIPFSVESTSNWQLSIAASEPNFRGVNDPTQTIPIDFISYHIENRGRNWDNGPFSNIANRTKDTLVPLKSSKTVVLAEGRKNNIGGSSRNSFVLRWKFNFETDQAKMREFSNLDIQEDQFIGRFYITLSESHISGESITIPTYHEGMDVETQESSPEISATIPQKGGYSEKELMKKLKGEKKQVNK